MKIGLLGGTFNPIHYGHLRAASEVRERLGLDKIVFVPAGTPPLKSAELAEARHRLAMVKLAVAGNPFFEVSDIECRYAKKSYTVTTLERLTRDNPAWEPYFIIGSDAFADLPMWRDPARLLKLARFVVMGRPGHGFGVLRGSPYLGRGTGKVLKSLDSGELKHAQVALTGGGLADFVALNALSVSSTEIRALLHAGRSVAYLLPQDVETYIINNQLYILKSTSIG